MKFTADFETITDTEDCRVWATGICNIDDYNFTYGNSIDFFFQHTLSYPNSYYYFHNLKFDGEFIFVWLFEHGYTWTDKKVPEKGEFNTLISDVGQFYSIKIQLDYDNKCVIYDSHKIIPFKVEKVAETFGLEEQKLEIDYTEYREPGHILTPTEVEYLKHDVVICAKALHLLFSQNLKKITQGSNALSDYKKTVGSKNFSKWFPTLEYNVDKEIRQSYKGGYTYVNPKYQGKTLSSGIVLDVNSLYPYVMYSKLLPYGVPKAFKGEYENDKLYPLYVQMIRCQFELKENHIPTIQIKHTHIFQANEYLTTSGNEEVVLCLTNVDLEIFKEHYDIINPEYLGGWKFKATKGLFKTYIDKWINLKIQAEKDGNKGMRQLCKLMLNALYGKFGLNPDVASKIPKYDAGKIKYKTTPKTTRKGIYIPMASFITAYARQITITSAQSVYDRFIYSDTDSLHLLGSELPENLHIDKYELGAWKHESTFTRGKFLRQKTYIEEIDGEVKITCAGMSDACIKYMREEENLSKDEIWKKFEVGSTFKGKLRPEHVVGGIVLVPVDFAIKV